MGCETIESLTEKGYKFLAMESLGYFLLDDDWSDYASTFEGPVNKLEIEYLFFWGNTPEKTQLWYEVNEGNNLDIHEEYFRGLDNAINDH